MTVMLNTDFIFMVLFCFAESLAGNWDEDDFLARIRDPKRSTRFGITPSPGLLSLVADASHGSLRTVSKMQSLVPRVVNDIRATGRNKSAGRCRLLHFARNCSCLRHRRTPRDRFSALAPMFHGDYCEQNQNRGSGKAEA